LLAARTPLGLGVTNLPDFFALNTLSIIPFAFSVTLTATAAPAFPPLYNCKKLSVNLPTAPS
jgi:hypothetical protein